MERIDLPRFYAKALARLHYFPLIASITWFSTLTILLIRWLALGRPRYPGQMSPYVPFVSDIAALAFKPIFIIGCTITAVCFVATVFSVHYVRYAESFYGLVHDARWRKTTSAVAMVTGTVAGSCLLLLSIFDTLEEHRKHRLLLVGTFGGLAISSVCTQVVWWDETWRTVRFPGLRKWCLVNNVLVTCITAFGVAFLVLIYSDYWGPAGLMEWIVTYLGAAWLGTFSGYLRFREEEGVIRLDLDDEPPSVVADP